MKYDVFGFFCYRYHMFVTFSGLVWFYVNTALYSNFLFHTYYTSDIYVQ